MILLALALQLGPPIKATPEEMAVRDYLAGLAKAVSDRSLADLTTKDAWEAGQYVLRRRVLSALGLDPRPKRTPLRVEVTSSFEEEAFRVETLLFRPLPGFVCTANLYLPKGAVERRPGILYVCGHSQDPLGAKVKYQHHPVWLASRGYVVLIVDPIQISEIEAIHHGTHRYGLWHWQALGYTPMGLEVWCAMRSLDLLESRPEVDPQRLGMTGRSGGGTMTWFTMAVDERVKAGVTANATGTVATHVRNDTLRGHCDCAFYVNHALVDYSDVAALCAPRAMLVQSGQKDWIYPPEGYRPLGAKARRVWELLGAPDRFKEQDVDAEHKDLMEFRTEAFRWFERHLRGVASTEQVTEVPKIDVDRLRAVRGDLPRDLRNHTIAEEFPGPALSKEPSEAVAYELGDALLRDRLRAQVFAGDPAVPCPLDPRELGTEARAGLAVRRVRIQSEPGMPIDVEILGAAKGPKVLVAVGADDLRPATAELPVLRVIPRGAGWSPELDKFVRRAAPLVGRSLGTMQAYDVRRGIAAAKELLGAERVVLYGKDTGALLALAASLHESPVPIERLILENAPDSLLAEPILLNVARVTDAPELLSLGVPQGLIFLGRPPLGFARTRQVAGLLGRPGLSIRAASMREALDELARGVP
jgi:dienelactone hydrolase